MTNTNKNTRIILGVVVVIIVGGMIFFINQDDGTYKKETISVEQDLAPIELSQEEQQVLKDEGLTAPSEEEDIIAKDLQSVRSSDEIDAIEADLNETDLSGLDAELEAIENDLFGL